jgi:hypothetical protein
MKKKACIVDIKTNSGKKYLREPAIDFHFCNISSSCDVVYKGTLIDTSWLLIYFTILWAFYLFE